MKSEPRLLRALRAVGRALLAIPRPLSALPALAWVALIGILSSQSIQSPTGTGYGWSVLWNMGHPFEFGVLAVLCTLLLPREQGWPVLSARPRWMLFAGIVLAALVDEWLQSLVPSRNASILDVLSDATGAWFALAAAACVAQRRSRELVWVLVSGTLACLLAAWLATQVPEWYPDVIWL